MSIGKKILLSLLGLSLACVLALASVSLYGFYQIKNTLEAENKSTINKLYTQNTKTIEGASEQVALSISAAYSADINGSFERIIGELSSVKSSIENLYNNGGTVAKPQINRHEEYIISNAADVSAEQQKDTLSRLSSATKLFDNMLSIEKNVSLAYLVLENGMVISSTSTFYPEVEKTDMRDRNWYKEAVAKKEMVWSSTYVSKTNGNTYITCAMPVYSNDKKALGVVACDLKVTDISKKVLQSDEKNISNSFLFENNGTVLLSTIGNEETKAMPFYSDFVQSVGKNKQGFYLKDNEMIGYSRIDATGWILATELDYEIMMTPVVAVGKSVTLAGEKMDTIINSKIGSNLLLFAIVASLVALLVIIMGTILNRSITNPIYALSRGVGVISKGNLDYKLEINTGDEIESLSQDVNKMTSELKNYIGNLKKVTAEKERIGAELDVATKIQASMLPCIFPAFPNRTEFDIYATMLPAKEVGGDFYDFFLIDDKHLAVVMADVSGKGVPAALFMVIAKTLIKNNVQYGNSPKEVFETVNNQLCESNEAGMFVTAFMGILEIETGIFTYVNAGHNPPLIKKANGDFMWLPTKAGFVLAGMEDMFYKQDEVILGKGDMLYMYTDGVTEAVNKNDDLFTEAKLLSDINKYKDCQLKDILVSIKDEIDKFADGAEQADDITMLAIKIN